MGNPAPAVAEAEAESPHLEIISPPGLLGLKEEARRNVVEILEKPESCSSDSSFTEAPRFYAARPRAKVVWEPVCPQRTDLHPSAATSCWCRRWKISRLDSVVPKSQDDVNNAFVSGHLIIVMVTLYAHDNVTGLCDISSFFKTLNTRLIFNASFFQIKWSRAVSF